MSKMADSDDDGITTSDSELDDNKSGSDHDDPDEDNDSQSSQDMGMNLTGFLFGNIDQKGHLENNVLDEDAKRQLNSLGRLGFQGLLEQLVREDKAKRSLEDQDDRENDFTDEAKSPTAEDFSDINELADEDPSSLRESRTPSPNPSDTDLMPPPRLPSRYSSQSNHERRLETPLAAMLPSKYANIDVREIFPDFRADKVLRFSKLFGPGKLSSLPQLWRGIRKRRKKKKSETEHDDFRPHDVKGFKLNYAPCPPQEMWDLEKEVKFLQPLEKDPNALNDDATDDNNGIPRVADWRFGPAQLWYDMLGVPETGEGFDYGIRARQAQRPPSPVEGKEPELEKRKPDFDFPDEAFLMVTQYNWEDDVIWNGEDVKHKVLSKAAPGGGKTTPGSGLTPANWLPRAPSAPTPPAPPPPKPASNLKPNVAAALAAATMAKTGGKAQQAEAPAQHAEEVWYSMFPVENDELVYGRWEDDVIWDVDHMDKIPQPRILTLDANDENVILGIPDDIDPATLNADSRAPVKVKIPHPHVRKSKLLLGKAGVINVLEDDTPSPPSEPTDKDPYNLSNDEYYAPKETVTAIKVSTGGQLIQHSTPVVELRAPFIPTHMGPMRLRNFHRPPLKRYSHGPLAAPGFHPVHPLLRHIRLMAKQRELERLAAGGGDIFFMRTPDDLSGKDGDMLLLEYCEEHPPLLSQVGMCTKVKNYYKRKAGKDTGPPEFKYGETVYAHTSPFLGTMHPGQAIQTIENNMYRAPMFEHSIPASDFIVIRTRNAYFIREADALFSVGQECPLYEVPGPNSKRANNFVRDFLQVFIYRLFWKSRDTPRRIRMDDIKRAFPAHSESSIRKRLKLCADFKRTGVDSNWWVIRPDFRLPTEEELRAMVSPEQCCAYFSMIASEQRLKDAGYGEKFLLAAQEDDDEEMQLKMDDEVKVAPWNTTRAYVHAMKNKCLLALTGCGDPTGCGEGFSYVRVPNKPQINKEDLESQPKRIVTGTDADLRRLSLANAKAILRKFCVPEEEIKKLSRWEVIDVVRTLSTEKAKAGEEGIDKFSRGNRFSIAEHQERYKEECQRVFDLQNRVLASEEVLSTDEAESSEEENEGDEDIEEMGKNIESMLANKKTSSQLTREKEEQERKELQRFLMSGEKGPKRDEDDSNTMMSSGGQNQTGRVLKIYRTFRNTEGKEYTRVELVRKPAIIDTYVRIRTTKDEAFIKQFATLDEHQKEEMKREKRRIQEQLRRIKRNQEKERLGLGTGRKGGGGASGTPAGKQKAAAKLSKADLKMKCGACGQVGHMRTNKACPLYQGSVAAPPMQVALTEEQEEEIEKQLFVEEDHELVNVDGTKMKLSSKLVKHAEEVKRRSLLLKVPKDAVGRRKRGDECDYLTRLARRANRRRTDPVVTLASLLEEILNELREMPDVQPFLFPVNQKLVPDYGRIVSRPMDLQTMRDSLREKRYNSREEFLADVNQIVENSSLYNGPTSILTTNAKNMLDLCIQRLAEQEDKFMKLEKAINPLLDDDDQVAFTYILDNIVNSKIKSMPEAWPFVKPVNKKMVKDYYTVVKQPMDLELIASKVKAHKYHARAEFLGDIQLLVDNSIAYNGADSPFTEKARTVLRVADETLGEYGDHVAQLEANISLAQQKARDRADEEEQEQYNDEMDDDSRMGDQEGMGTPEVERRKKEDAAWGDDDGSKKKKRGRPAGKGRGRRRKASENFTIPAPDHSEQASGLGNSSRIGKRKSDLLEEDLVYSSEGGDDDLEAVEDLDSMSMGRSFKDESMDIDASYDPEAELLGAPGPSGNRLPPGARSTRDIHDDLEVSESEEEGEIIEEHEIRSRPRPPPSVPTMQYDDDNDGNLWF